MGAVYGDIGAEKSVLFFMGVGILVFGGLAGEVGAFVESNATLV